MVYDRRIIDFWYEFDLLFNPAFGQVPTDIAKAYGPVSGLLFDWLAARNKQNIEYYPENFIARITRTEETNAIRLLADHHLRIIGEKLDYEVQLQKAFQFFGQGVLFDNLLDEESHLPRRPNNDKVHMMDVLHFGYPRWHVFCRSAAFIDLDKDIWLKIDRLVGLAYALHMELKPRQSEDGSDPQNPERPDVVKHLLPMFTSYSFDGLDGYFDNKYVRSFLGHV
ncbi:MAG: hypothetical protein M3247_03975 [Thermoproteota archaeon]|nr:hypothetical protein [Thermoproteota archaeon]